MQVLEQLSPKSRSALERAIRDFRQYIQTEDFRRYLQDRKNRTLFFQKELSSRLENLSEADVEQIVGYLWAHQMWGNKTYVAQKIVQENTLERLRDHIQMLYQMAEDPEEAYARFLKSIKRWGPASVTEILAYIYPQRCGIWNRQARVALQVLGLTNIVDTNKYELSKEEYRKFNSLLNIIADALRQAGIPDVDFLIVDFLLYRVAQRKVPRSAQREVPSEPLRKFDHDEVRDLIAGLGAKLGFDTETEVNIAHGARVDVVWRARIANLGIVTYVFEVHRSGSIDSLILNLQKALNAPTVQKVVAVSDEKQLRTIEKECEGLPEPFRRVLRFWDVQDVIRVAQAMEQVMDSITRLGLLEVR